MKKIFGTDIREKKEFSAEGDILKQKFCFDEEKHIWVYERVRADGKLIGYELVKGKKSKGKDGSPIYTYPSSEQFGDNGYFIPAQFADKDIPKYLLCLKYGRKEGERKWQEYGQNGEGLRQTFVNSIIPHLR